MNRSRIRLRRFTWNICDRVSDPAVQRITNCFSPASEVLAQNWRLFSPHSWTLQEDKYFTKHATDRYMILSLYTQIRSESKVPMRALITKLSQIIEFAHEIGSDRPLNSSVLDMMQEDHKCESSDNFPAHISFSSLSPLQGDSCASMSLL